MRSLIFWGCLGGAVWISILVFIYSIKMFPTYFKASIQIDKWFAMSAAQRANHPEKKPALHIRENANKDMNYLLPRLLLTVILTMIAIRIYSGGCV